MKNQLFLFALCFLSFNLKSQTDSTGLPGDQFSLEGALELFKQSNNPEEFEKLINTESNQVNNLDLNNDGEIDYIKVIGKKEKDAHVFILQVPISESENQDIAVIEIEKKGKSEANIQIVGDEDIFGEERIVEPSDGSVIDDDEEDAEGGPSPNGYTYTRVIFNVWTWPCVMFVYAPAYVVWNSPWRWHHYPGFWKPWRPLAWHVWHPYRARYFGPSIRVVHTHRLIAAHRMYSPVRVHSTAVRTRYAGAHKNYTVTRKKTTVTGPKGHSRTKTKTTVRGPKGNVKTQRTHVRRGKH